VTGRASKTKGHNAEREIVKMAHALDIDAVRAWGSNGRSLGHPETVDVTLNESPWQVKRRAKVATYIKPPAGTIGTLIREDRGEWLAVLPARTLLELVARTGIDLHATWTEQ